MWFREICLLLWPERLFLNVFSCLSIYRQRIILIAFLAVNVPLYLKIKYLCVPI